MALRKCNIVIMPWQPNCSPFQQTLWEMAKKSARTAAAVVDVPQYLAAVAGGAIEGRDISESSPKLPEEVSSSFRKRSASIFDAVLGTSSEEPTSATLDEQLSTAGNTGFLESSIKRIVAVVTPGAAGDEAVALVKRFAENTPVVLYVPKGTFPESCGDQELREEFLKKAGAVVTTMASDVDDAAAVVNELAKDARSTDLFIAGFVPPLSPASHPQLQSVLGTFGHYALASGSFRFVMVVHSISFEGSSIQTAPVALDLDGQEGIGLEMGSSIQTAPGGLDLEGQEGIGLEMTALAQ